MKKCYSIYSSVISGEVDVKLHTATDRHEAMKIPWADRFSTYFSDYKMPKVSGGELCQFKLYSSEHAFFLFSGWDLSDYPECETSIRSIWTIASFTNRLVKNIVKEIKRLYEHTISVQMLRVRKTVENLRLTIVYSWLRSEKSRERFSAFTTRINYPFRFWDIISCDNRPYSARASVG